MTLPSVFLFDKEKMFSFMNLCKETSYAADAVNKLNIPDDDSVEIPTRCSFVIEFIIPKFIEGSTCFERHTAHHQGL